MLEKLLLASALLVAVVVVLPAQKGAYFSAQELEKLDNYEDTIALVAYAVVNDSLPEYRFGACQKLITTLVEALKTPNSFHYPFKRVQSVSVQYPADSSFRIFTWQLYVDVNEYRYFGAIQMNTPELKLYALSDRSFQIEESNLEQMVLSPEQWYGAVYYNLQEFKSADKTKRYLLFGFDAYHFFHKRKIIDVLSFDASGAPVFGAPVFYHKPEDKAPFTKNRVVLQYSAEASVHLNYDPEYEKIIFDHLIVQNGRYGEGPTAIPDGSYDAYKLEKGRWVYIDKVFNDSQDTPPMLNIPGKDGKKRDLFGN